MAPTILETTSTIITEYADEDWTDEKHFRSMAAVLSMIIGSFCEALGRDDSLDAHSCSRIRVDLEYLKIHVASEQLETNPVALARFTSMIDALDSVVACLSVSYNARLERNARSERLTPKIEWIQAVLNNGYQAGSIQIRALTVKQICDILEYNIAGIHYLADLIPQPNSYYADQLQLDLLWFANNKHIDRTVPHAIGWAFVDGLVS